MRLLRTLAIVIALSFFGAVALNADTRPEPTLPPLPDSIPSQLGWVTVHRVPNLTCGDGEQVLGCFEQLSRTLSIRDSMNLAVSWQTLRHEQVHMILSDAGIRIPVRGLEDVLADAIGAARVTEMVADRKR